MSFLPLLHFLSFIIYSYLAVFVLIKNLKSSLNRVCSVFLLTFAMWSFGMIFIHNPYVSKDIARLSRNIISASWCSFASFYLWFILIFTERKKILKTKPFYLFLFILPSILIYGQWRGFLIVDFILQPWGWAHVWSGSIWQYLFYIYYSSFIAGGIYLTIDFSKKTGESVKKKQAKIIYASSIISLTFGTLTDALSPDLHIYTIPNIGNFTVLILALGIVYAIAKYKFLIITPATAADSIISTMADSLILLDKKRNMVTVNKATLDLLGYRKDELEGRSIGMLSTGKNFKNTLLDRTIKEEAITSYELNFKTKSGENVPVILSSSVLRGETGDIVGIVCIARDITERKNAEETLIRSEKLRALGEMAAGVAHGFNNLLAIILGNAQLLERGMERYKAEEIKHRLKIIARTASEGGETVRRLQYFTGRKVSRQDFTKIDLNEIVKEAIASTSPRWKDEAEAKGTTIKIKEKLGKLPSILGSRSELMEVLTNLIFNALESMSKGGEITIRTEAKENEVLLYFTDTGKGVPDRIKRKIFDPFFTTKGPKASGLGLSICYGIIKRHQGKIKVESKEGKETTFTISIPVGLEAPLKKEKLKDPEKIPSQKILVIDDEEGIREVLGEIFQNEGHRVTLAETARKGLDKFKKNDFDLVLTDLGMPEISGWQLAKKIKEIDPGIPVGLITGWVVATPKEKMKEEGVDFILSKPFDYTKIVREVNALLKS